MNLKAVIFIKNIFFAVSANISRIIISFLLTLLLPKIMNVEEYSYWQLYLFYSTYLMFSSVGWCEGTYLKYGGKQYRMLDGRVMASQFWGLAVYEILFFTICAAIFIPHMEEKNKTMVLLLACVFTFFYIMKYQIQIILQAVNRIRDYALVYTSERILYFLLVLGTIFREKATFSTIAVCEIVSTLVTLMYGCWICREVILRRPAGIKVFTAEAIELIRCGYKLTLASFASQLIIGIIRFAIEQKWGTVVFGKISLSFSMSNMMITCIVAVSIVLFPMLKNMKTERLVEIYSAMRIGLSMPLYGVLIFYEPVSTILRIWIPQYDMSLKYLAILFPVCIYEIRNSVLICTYLKAIRKESLIMKANIILVAVSAGMTAITVYLLQNLNLAIFSVVFLYAAKCIYTEKLLLKEIAIKAKCANWKESILTLTFIGASFYIEAPAAFIIYLVSYMIYLSAEKKEIKHAYSEIKQMFTSKRGENNEKKDS